MSDNIRWINNSPFSTIYKDIYFSKEYGIEESEYVFLHHNKLKDRFLQLGANARFTIIESGFGTGLNFLCAWKLFDSCVSNGSKLHFISIEKHPLTKEQLRSCLSERSSIHKYYKKFIKSYNADSKTMHYQLSANVSLSVYFMDISEAMQQIRASANAWFLDGFAPANNPEMWTTDFFNWMSVHSHKEATFATFTAARIVRDGLQNAGFSIVKSPGFRYKRDMISGYIKNPRKKTKPWNIPVANNSNKKTATIIGAGLSGISCAYALAQRNWKVTVIEDSSNIATGTSGNLQGVIYAKLSEHNSALNKFLEAGVTHCVNFLDAFGKNLFNKTGVIQTAADEYYFQKQEAIAAKYYEHASLVESQELSVMIGLPLAVSGLYFANCGWVNLGDLCKELSKHKNINIETSSKITHIDQTSAGGWHISDGSKTWEDATVIIATGNSANTFKQANYLPLKSIRGQITYIAATKQSKKLAKCVCSNGYVTPSAINSMGQEFHSIGATFDLHSTSAIVSTNSHKQNINKLKSYFPAMFEALNGDAMQLLGGRVGFRCTTPDYLPVVGPIVETSRFINKFKKLTTNANAEFNQDMPYLPGLYVSSGHGSRGLISCLLSSELLAKVINNEDCIESQALINSLNPNRFLIRDVKRRVYTSFV